MRRVLIFTVAVSGNWLWIAWSWWSRRLILTSAPRRPDHCYYSISTIILFFIEKIGSFLHQFLGREADETHQPSNGRTRIQNHRLHWNKTSGWRAHLQDETTAMGSSVSSLLEWHDAARICYGLNTRMWIRMREMPVIQVADLIEWDFYARGASWHLDLSCFGRMRLRLFFPFWTGTKINLKRVQEMTFELLVFSHFETNYVIT